MDEFFAEPAGSAIPVIAVTHEHLPAWLSVQPEHVRNWLTSSVHVTRGDELAGKFPMIHAVGRASVVDPRLIDMTWGDAGERKVTLVGKGVCFDSGLCAGDALIVDACSGAVQRLNTRGVDVTCTVWRDSDRLLLMGIRDLETVIAEVSAGQVRELITDHLEMPNSLMQLPPL